MNNDFSTPIAIAHLFDGVRIINLVKENKETLTSEDIFLLKKTFEDFLFDIFGLTQENTSKNNDYVDKLMDVILSIRKEAKNNKDFQISDSIRNSLAAINITIKDTKEGAEWHIE